MSLRRYLYCAASLAAILFLFRALAQYPPSNPPVTVPAQPGTPMPAQQLDDLVAPIAFYPDPLVAEILAASTYPMEIAEAQQWVRDHPKWKPSKLMDEAKKQNWDPSVQGLVAWPAHYRVSGIHTFIVNQAGVVYEKDIPPAAGKPAPSVARFDPDSSWQTVG